MKSMRRIVWLSIVILSLGISSCQNKDGQIEAQLTQLKQLEKEFIELDNALMGNIQSVLNDTSFQEDLSVFEPTPNNSINVLVLDHAYFSKALELDNNYDSESYFGALDWAININADQVKQLGLMRLHVLASTDVYLSSDKKEKDIDFCKENPCLGKLKQEFESNSQIAFLLVSKTSKFYFENNHLSVAGMHGYLAVMNKENKNIAAVIPIKAENSAMIDQIVSSGESVSTIERKAADDFKTQLKFSIANEIRRRYVSDNSTKINVLI